MKHFYKKCKELLLVDNKTPKFIKPKDLKKGMELQRWFESSYQPTHGKYRQCDGTAKILKIDGDMIYTILKWNKNDNYETTVNITMREDFQLVTVEKSNNQ